MRGGVARWKRGVASRGVRQAVNYALGGVCDASPATTPAMLGADAAAGYADAMSTRYVVENGTISADALTSAQLRTWIDGNDPATAEHRGRELPSPAADLLLDSTINAPKSYSVAAMLDPELSAAFDELQDRLRDRVIVMWQRELNARRGAGGCHREDLERIEVVELRHERSRSLDPHRHRHLWLNVKVRGRDGRWSNIDSRVALKFQTVVNAEGDLAARTDPEWLSALAAKGYTLDANGEIAELAHLVRPLSRRSTQIEANRAARLAEWRTTHPGIEPDRDVLAAIDRWAWATGRPNKPDSDGFDEERWADLVRSEIADIDPALGRAVDRPQVSVAAVTVADLDREFLMERAVIDADNRSSANGGRFSRFDVRAGAIRAVAGSGVVAGRDVLDELIEDVVDRAVASATVNFLDGEADVPDHIKQFMSVTTANLKSSLAAGLDRLAVPGHPLDREIIEDTATTVLGDERTLNEGQLDAAAAIAGTDRLCSVVGPAGTGKTTLLQVARVALQDQDRRMVIVAPTKKAASVAGRETRAEASSLHAFLLDQGWRWDQTGAGEQRWVQLRPGDVEPDGVRIYNGPRSPLVAGDRVVVDEAGMVDLHTASALAIIAEQTGAGIAMIGDPLQALPVGHSGAMGMLTQRATARAELSAVHRFVDPNYAALTLALRNTTTEEEATVVARELIAGGHVTLVDDADGIRDHMLERWFEVTGRRDTIALVTATHQEAQEVNEKIQAERIVRGQLDPAVFATGQDGQRIHRGDVVQTRQNNRSLDVENRANWTVKAITSRSVVLASLTDSGDTRTVGLDYFERNVHLAYASTVHGVQGETTTESIVGPGCGAGGLYVGVTRGRESNTIVLASSSEERAIAELVDTMYRGRPEVTLSDGVDAAKRELKHAARRVDAVEEVPAWDDAKARPVGHVTDLDSLLDAVRHRQPIVHKSLAAIADRLAVDRRTLLELDASIAKRRADNHQAAATGHDQTTVDDLEALRDRLGTDVYDNEKKRRVLTREYSQIVRAADDILQEQRHRERMPAELLAVEGHYRRSRELRIKHGAAASLQPQTSVAAPSNGRGLGLV